jgi:hypothetical protein
MVLYYVKGVNGQIEVFEDKIVITRKGLVGFSTHGLAGEKTIPMSAIQSVQFRKGGMLANGFIQFAVLGGIERQSGVCAAVQDENTVMLMMGEQSNTGKTIKEYIESRILELSKQQATIVQQTSVADEIVKFKALLDAGVITQEEFDMKKKQLLGL